MFFKDWLFWNVDTQNDFILPSGKLYVSGAEMLKPLWKEITKFAYGNSIRVVNSADFHYADSAEISSEPDFIKTFPQHCMAGSEGAGFIPETNPDNPFVVDWDKPFPENKNIDNFRNIVIRKDAFDVFTGNPFTEKIVEELSPVNVVVYGVTTNVCVDYAVVGLTKRARNVYVIEDAIKELPGIPMPVDDWVKMGVKMVKFDELQKLLGLPDNTGL